jgi:predicted TPR repeat methyltransferase
MDDLQSKSREYWERAQTTYLASEEYYIAQQRGLLELLERVGSIDRAIDLGCGDGRFTMVASKFCKSIEGVDINAALVARAGEATANQSGIAFSMGSVEEFVPSRKFDLVLCMGVISALMRECLFDGLCDKLYKALNFGGWLITKDTLATGEAYQNISGAYTAYYRNRSNYVARFERSGLRLMATIELGSTDSTTNGLFLFGKLGESSCAGES